MRAGQIEGLRQIKQVDRVSLLEGQFTDPVLLSVMIAAKRKREGIAWLEAHTAVRSIADMRAFDRALVTAWHRTLVAAHPCTMRGSALALIGLA